MPKDKGKDGFKLKQYKLNPEIMEKLMDEKKMNMADLYQRLYQEAAKYPMEEGELRKRYQEKGSEVSYWLNSDPAKRRYFPNELVPALEKVFNMPFQYFVDGKFSGYHGSRGIEYCAYSKDAELREELKETDVLFQQDEFSHSFLFYCLKYDWMDALVWLMDKKDYGGSSLLSVDMGWRMLNGRFHDVTPEILFDYIVGKDDPEVFSRLFDAEQYEKIAYWEEAPSFVNENDHLAKLFKAKNIVKDICGEHSEISFNGRRATEEGKAIRMINPWIAPLLRYGTANYDSSFRQQLLMLFRVALEEDERTIDVVSQRMNENAEKLKGYFLPTIMFEKNGSITQNGYVLGNFISGADFTQTNADEQIEDYRLALVKKENKLKIAMNQNVDSNGIILDAEENTHNLLEKKFFQEASGAGLSFIPTIIGEDEKTIHLSEIRGQTLPNVYAISERGAVDCAKKLRKIYDLSKNHHYVHDFLKQSDIVLVGDEASSIIGWNRVKEGDGSEDLLCLCLLCIDEFKRDDDKARRIKSVLDTFGASKEIRDGIGRKLIDKCQDFLSRMNPKKKRADFLRYRNIQTFLLLNEEEIDSAVAR